MKQHDQLVRKALYESMLARALEKKKLLEDDIRNIKAELAKLEEELRDVE